MNTAFPLRLCKDCSEDITDYDGRHKYCPDCGMARGNQSRRDWKRKQAEAKKPADRPCKMCGESLLGRNRNTLYCLTCQPIRIRQGLLDYAAGNREKVARMASERYHRNKQDPKWRQRRRKVDGERRTHNRLEQNEKHLRRLQGKRDWYYEFRNRILAQKRVKSQKRKASLESLRQRAATAQHERWQEFTVPDYLK